jgi:hypothetical protein
MTTQVDLDRLVRQTRQYEFRDGLRDLQMALMFVLYGLVSWLLFRPSWWAFLFNIKSLFGQWTMRIIALLVLLSPAIAVWGTLGIMTYLRRRWLWRESGIVKASRVLVPRSVTILSGIIAIGGILLSAGLHISGQMDDLFLLRSIWAVSGWSAGCAIIGLGHSIGLVRYVWLGLIGALLSTLAVFLPCAFGETALAFGAAWGLLFTLSGAVALHRTWSSSRR